MSSFLQLVCLLALVAGISASPTLLLKPLLLKKALLLGKLGGHGEAHGPAPYAPVAPVAYHAEPTYYYAQPAAPAPVVVEARQAPVPAPGKLI